MATLNQIADMLTYQLGKSDDTVTRDVIKDMIIQYLKEQPNKENT